MQRLIFAGIIFILHCFLGEQMFAQARTEFNGPFASWANVKTRFNAKGDGIKDDTKAIQKAIDSLSCIPIGFNKNQATAYTTIYLPKGKYRITETLNLRGKIGINIIGEDPANTTIQWAGKDNDTMLWSNGSAYFKIARLTFDGGGRHQIEGIGIHWVQKWNEAFSRSYASLNIEIADCVFTDNLSVGIGGGYNWNDSEVKINRCVFDKCLEAGVQIQGYNALDYWIWYCRFYNCGTGIISRSGNCHAYSCYFTQSIYNDVLSDKGYYTSVRSCFSDDSRVLYCDLGSSSNPFKRTFQDNVVKKPHDIPVQYAHAGKLTFFNNQIDEVVPTKVDATLKAPSAARPYAAYYAGWFGTNYNVLSIGNTYFYDKPFLLSSKFPKKVYSANDTYGKKVTANAADFIAKLPVTPAFVKRKIFDVPAGASAEVIQEIINNAAKLKGQRPVVHFPVGRYMLTHTIVIPAGSDMQLVGDGYIYASVMYAGNPFTGTSLIKIKGPSGVELRDLHLGNGNAKTYNGVEFENIDQPSSYVHIDQLYSQADTSLFVNKLNYTRFEKNNSFFSDGNIIIGGSKQKAGQGTLSVNCFGGQFKGITVMNNGSFTAKDCWWEGAARVPVDLQGDGNVTIDGVMMAPTKADSMPTIRIAKFSGNISLMNMYVQGGVSLAKDNSKLKALFWNINFYHKMNVLNAIPPGFNGQVAFAGINAQCFDKNTPLCSDVQTINDKFVNITDENNYFNEMTLQDRTSRPVDYRNLPSGVSNIYIERVTLEGGKVGLKFSE